MKRTAALLLMLLTSAGLLAAQDKGKANQMTGWICDSKCIIETNGRSACDQNCSETSGQTVFVNEDGHVMQIANQDMAKSHAGKKVRMNATMDESHHMLSIQNVVEYGGGGM